MKKSMLILSAAMALLCSCSKEVTSPAISLGRTLTGFPCTGGTVKVPVSCNCSWTASCEVENVMIAPASHTGDCNVSITVPPTDSKTTSTVRVVFQASAGNSTATVGHTITLAAAPFIESPQTAATTYVSGQACTGRIYIESNEEWEYVSSFSNRNLTVYPTEGEGCRTVSVDFPASTKTSTSTFNLTFRLKSDENKKITVKFIQYGKNS